MFFFFSNRLGCLASLLSSAAMTVALLFLFGVLSYRKTRPAMHLVELLLPLNDNSGLPFGVEKYDIVRQQLTERFGGLTAFTRSPAQGSTKGDGKTVHDEIIVFEVMTKTLDVSWWGHYRLNLEREFRQDEILVRASTVTVL